jgi:uncharacterized phage-associated protein
MYDARSVARTMIQRAADLNLPVTNLKLQKLLYFAHGLSLVRCGKPLINEPFQAWKYGPVLVGLYHDLKVFGPSPIKPQDGFIPYWPEIPTGSNAEIDAVLNQFGALSGGQLINISHDPKGPWQAVYHSASKNIEIDNQAIQSYFKTIVQ